MQWSKLFATLVAGASSLDIQECSGSCNSSSTNEQIALVQRHASRLAGSGVTVEHDNAWYNGFSYDDWDSVAWSNNWDNNLNFECSHSNNEVLVGMYSEHDNGFEDRRYKLKCAPITPKTGYITPTLVGCTWSTETGWDAAWTEPNHGAPFSSTWENNYVITGLSSRHDNGREDRVWKFKSCRMNNAQVTGNSGFDYNGRTRWRNSKDGVLNEKFNIYSFIRDIKSEHCNGAEDRRFAFDTASFQYIPEPTATPTQNPTSTPTHSPTTHPTSTPTGPKGSASASGDPHLIDMDGKRFDILKTGQMSFD